MATANNGLNIVILDACRNNPFPLEAKDGTRASRRIGLVEVKPGVNELIAFSAQQGVVADDGPSSGNQTQRLHIIKEELQKLQNLLSKTKE